MNLIRLFEDYNIQYWDKGKNVTSGWVNITCPFCNDKTNHGGFNISENKPYYNCWKCGSHPVYETLNKILPEYVDFTLYGGQSKSFIKKEISQFKKPFKVPGSSKHRIEHIRYLRSRGLRPTHYYIEKYDIRFTDYSDYNLPWRLVFPIYYNNRIVSWQTRTISKNSELRYITADKSEEIIHHKDILYNLDNCKKDKLIIVEGIFDVLKMGDDTAGTFGTSFTEKQIEVLKRFKKAYLLFDNEKEAQEKAENMAFKLYSVGVDVEVVKLKTDNDVGGLSIEDCFKIKNNLLF